MVPSNGKTPKIELEVNIVLTDGTTLECCFFAAQGQRLLELMNDHRDYIPYTDADGDVSIIRKSTIARITPVEQIASLNKRIAANG